MGMNWKAKVVTAVKPNPNPWHVYVSAEHFISEMQWKAEGLRAGNAG